MFCMSCGSSILDSASFCPCCGAKVKRSSQNKTGMYLLACKSCGSSSLRRIRKGEYLCEHCGSKWIADEQNSSVGVEEQDAVDTINKSILSQAKEYHNKGEHQKALLILAKGLDEDLENYSILFWLGKEYYQLDNLEKALECYKKAEKLYTDDPTLFVNIGLIYFSMGQYQMAKLQYEKAIAMIEADPASVAKIDITTAYGNYGYCIGMMGDRENAKKYLSRAKAEGYYPNVLKYVCEYLELDLNDL